MISPDGLGIINIYGVTEFAENVAGIDGGMIEEFGTIVYSKWVYSVPRR